MLSPTVTLPEERRKEIFAVLVSAQDRGVAVPESRREVAARFGVTLDQVVQIERDGMDNEWPPL